MYGFSNIWKSFFRGLTAGIPFGIGLATGISPTKDGVSEFIATQLCTASTSQWVNTLNCDLFFFIMLLLTGIMTIWQLLDNEQHYSYSRLMGFIMYFTGGFATTIMMYILLS